MSNGTNPGEQSPPSGLRWAGQRTDAIAPDALPALARVSNLIRSVQSPEFHNVTFHEVLAKSALNHVDSASRMLPDEWTINPYRGCTHACFYCYARPTHGHLGFGAEEFETQIVVKTNIAEVLRNELKRKRELPPRVSLGTSTDPYQRAEGRYKLMPGIIQALGDTRVPFSILTKGTLIRRDLTLLAAANERAHVEPGLSISLIDDALQQSLEPGTPSTAARLKTVTEIREAGLDCAVFIAPILPLLSDRPDQLEAMVRSIAEAGATSVLYTSLFLSPRVRPTFFSWLSRSHPELVARYQSLYKTGASAPESYRVWLRGQLFPLLKKYGLPLPDADTADKFGLNGASKAPAQRSTEPTLF
ncbi:DNA repair photolyase [Agromyces ramosus]|uniref:DNA repair photolyase n=1 Tax=Agromyces ramosus TaxID=33879 RepID=A0A4Q7MIB0_9MICO|nr:radical SAM protein [Agromyces ramosus]RZS66462.1 DNA repair photolyase [Agromyces ramosus]